MARSAQAEAQGEAEETAVKTESAGMVSFRGAAKPSWNDGTPNLPKHMGAGYYRVYVQG